jgi:hypothetical protein
MKSIIEHVYNGVTIHQRADGYWNASAMCRANGKTWSHYKENDTTEEFMIVLSRSLGIPRDVLVQTQMNGPNEVRGTWVHPRIAMNLAQWCSPLCAVKVSGWIEELLTTGHVDLRPVEQVPEDPVLALLHHTQKSLEAIAQTRQAQIALEYRVDGMSTALEQANAAAAQARAMAQEAMHQVERDTGFRSIKGYLKSKGVRMPTKMMARHGKAVTKICKERGLPYHKTPDEQWDEVNVYPVEILDEYFKDLLFTWVPPVDSLDE